MGKIFALDIGTRKVAGLIAQVENGILVIKDCQIMEHQTRAMQAGQIHDVDKVASIVSEIKQVLEQRSGEKLEKAAVAVAGRNLRTFQGQTVKNVTFENEITTAEILDLELAAVQQVLADLNKGPTESLNEDFYCVGYSVVNYYLDKSKIKSLIGQRGREIGVQIIATFLPKMVLESMFSVLKKAGLEISLLTLEPIAAINAIISPDMRRLNLALVDIGAGTSDLAITGEGSVVAYGMVPLAGDSITEKLCELYLLDFCVGERVKRSLGAQPQIDFIDIFGKSWSLPSTQIIADLTPAVSNLAVSIVAQIMTLNKTVPQALVCVGGGSLTPMVLEKLSQHLNLARERVGIRGPAMISHVHDDTGKLGGPEAITPLGIATVAAEKEGLQFINVTVNGKIIRLVNINQKLNVLSALIAVGLNAQKLHGRPGLAKTFELEGDLRIIAGTLGNPATVLLNDQIVNLETPLGDKDIIKFEPALDGQDGQAKIRDIFSLIFKKKIVLNEQLISVGPAVYMNEQLVDLDTEIVDLAKIKIKQELTLRELLKQKCELTQPNERNIFVTINDEPRIITQQGFHLLINGQEASLDAPLNDGDVVEYTPNTTRHYQIKEVLPIPPAGKPMILQINGQEITMEGQKGKFFMNGLEVSPDEFIISGADIKTVPGKDAQLIMVDLLRYVPLSIEQNQGKKLKMLLNGIEANFTTVLTQGAEIKIFFE